MADFYSHCNSIDKTQPNLATMELGKGTNYNIFVAATIVVVDR